MVSRADDPNIHIKNYVLMKNPIIVVISMAIFSLFFTGCCKDKDDSTIGSAKVTVRISDFSISQENMDLKSTSVGDYAGVKAITLAFYKSDGTEAYKHTQLKDDASTYTTFGEFSTSLTMGSFKMVVLGYGYFDGDVLELTSPTSAIYTSDRVRETFAATEDITITNCDAVNLTATLNRVVAKVQVVSTDNRTADVANIRMTFSGGAKGFNPTTGLATSNTGFANTVQGSGDTGATTTATSYIFLATDEQTVDVTIETLDADGAVLFSKTVNDVPLKRNRQTTLTGAMYTNAGVSPGSFQLNTDWLTGNDVSF